MSRQICRGCALKQDNLIAEEVVGDSKTRAAAKVTILEQALELLGQDPVLAETKKGLERELEAQRRAAKDNRSIAMKVDQKQGWIDREKKRVETEEKQLQALQASLEKRKAQLNVEMEEVQSLRRMIAEGMETPEAKEEGMTVDATGDPGLLTPKAVAELRRLESKELELRRCIARKRKPSPHEGEASDSELEQWTSEVETLSVEIDGKRLKLERAATAHRGAKKT